MSFGFREEQEQISTAIYRGLAERRERLILVAAAANDGVNAEEMFPASHNSVISIRATNGTGEFQTSFNPPKKPMEKVVLGTLGRMVPHAGLEATEGEEQYGTGTSFAAAIAAGLGALLLSYVDQNSSRDTYSKVKDKIMRKSGMTAVFHRLSVEMRKGHDYLSLEKFYLRNESERWSLIEDAVGTE